MDDMKSIMKDEEYVVDFENLRYRWRESLTGCSTDGLKGAVNDHLLNTANDIRKDADVSRQLTLLAAEAGRYQNFMLKQEDRTCLWEDLHDPGNPYRRDSVCLSTLRRIEEMALAFRSVGCTLKGNESLKKDILDALDFIYQNWYNESLRKGGEWWHKEIGIPLCLNTCVLLMYPHLEEAKRDGYMRAVESFSDAPDWMCIEDVPEISTGANRAWKCLVLAGCGILTDDPEKLAVASREIKDVFRYTDHRDGFYRDGSFIQHLKFAYTGGYGASFLETIVDFMELLRDTPWEIEGQELTMILEWVSKSYEPFLFRGGFMSMTMGRGIARMFAEEHVIGHEVIQALVRLAYSLKEETALTLKRKIKTWITSDAYRDFLEHASIPVIGLTREILQDPMIPAFEFPAFCGIYPAMDRVVHRRKDFAIGISMSSERTGKYESIHNENVRGWYTADGMVYLYNSDLGQYSDGYFPTINAYRMPGTTVDTIVRAEEGVGFGREPKLHNAWVGGASLKDLYGVAGMDLEAECSDLQAKKSWFLFDKEIVCLGAGITCTGGREIETIVENRKVPADKSGIVTINGDLLLQNASEKLLRNDVRSIHLEGPSLGSDIGYYFPENCDLEILEEERTSSWRSINQNSGSDEEVTNSFVNIVIHHGRNPENDTYEYVLLPGMSCDEVQCYSTAPSAEVIQNTATVQAVKQKELNILAANFWKDESCKVEGITCNKKASVILQEKDDCISMAVSDPTWKNEQGIQIELDYSAVGVISCDEGVRVIQLHPTVIILVETKNAMGKSFQVCLKI